MRFSAVLLALVSAASGLSLFGGGDQNVVTNDDLKIPGESPLELCAGDHGDDIVQIERVDLLPNPPEAYVVTVSSLPFP